jgi:energy-coupling factor transporter ATP-binding protein EcfA2/GNAT superfamily N-acetyltransferase
VRETITLRSSIERTARVTQVAGMFDYQLGAEQTLVMNHDLAIESADWKVGLIVGASGGGKSQLARRLWGDNVRERHEWDSRAIIDNFPLGTPIDEITSTLTAVGFGTVPAWVRPYSTLSNGEQFRADMARSIIEATDPIVIDEFTSVVDRQVAKVASHAVQKAIRRSPDKRFVAVTCHYDVEDWLQPDWVYDVSTLSFVRRLVQPHPALDLEVFPASRTHWRAFSRHHYLSAELHNAAQCFVAYIDGRPVAFTSYLHFMHAKTRNIKMGHRLVVLPDYQGLGIAGRLENWLGMYLWERGFRYRNVVAHPAMIRLYSGSPRWRDTGRSTRVATSSKSINKAANLSSRRLAVRSFEYTPPKGSKA